MSTAASTSAATRTTPPPPDDQPSIALPPVPSGSSSSIASTTAMASASSPSPTSSSSSSAAPSASTSSPSTPVPAFFPTHAIDHAFAGIAAGAAATVCMNPLDLIKTKFQVDTTKPRAFRLGHFSSTSASASRMGGDAGSSGAGASSASPWKGKARSLADGSGESIAASQTATASRAARGWRYYALGGKVGQDMVSALQEIVRNDGWKGLYRGLSPNVVGNSASWGFYFLWYTMIKEYMASGPLDADGNRAPLSAGQHLLAASESGAITAMMTNPVWVVKTRMFTTPTSLARSGAKDAPEVYRGLWHGLTSIASKEGIRGLYKGAGLALFGVSNGAIQFMAYEELKKWRTAVAMRRMRSDPRGVGGGSDGKGKAEAVDGAGVMLSNVEYVFMSGVSKVAAILLTYPYQVIRSRIQNHATSHLYPNILTCIRLTYTREGLRGFYKGMVPNLVRILPGTCVTFVVYENVSWGLRGLAQRRERRREVERGVAHGSVVMS